MDYAKYTQANLHKVKVPVLIAHSKKDDFIVPENANLINTHIGSTDKALLWLTDSDHVITEGPERGMLFETIQAFIQAHRHL
jgi:esterase/lipase